MKKKLLALLLVAALVIATLPSSIFAADSLQILKSDGSAAVEGTDYEVTTRQVGTESRDVYALKTNELTIQGGDGTEIVTINNSVYNINKLALKDANFSDVQVGEWDATPISETLEIVSTGINTISYVGGYTSLKLSGNGCLSAKCYNANTGDVNFVSGEYSCDGVRVKDPFINAEGAVFFAEDVKFYAATDSDWGFGIYAKEEIYSASTIYASREKLAAEAITTKADIVKQAEDEGGLYTICVGTERPKSVAIGYVKEAELTVIQKIRKILKDETTTIADVVDVLESESVENHTMVQQNQEFAYGDGKTVLNTYVNNDTGVKGIASAGGADITKAVASAEELETVKNGGTLDVLALADAITIDNADEKTAIQNAAGSNWAIAYSIDLTITKQMTKANELTVGKKEEVTDTNEVIYISVIVPESVRASYNNFKVVRYHKGTATLIEPESYNSTTGELVFGSNQFSDFAIVGTYNPSTGVAGSNGLWAVLALIVCAGALAVVTLKQRGSVK